MNSENYINIKHWQEFFTALAPFFDKVEQEKEVALDYETWGFFLKHANERLSAYRSEGRGLDIMELLAPGRDETKNTNLLAWLLDCNSSHGQGCKLLGCLLSLAKHSEGLCRESKDIFPEFEAEKAYHYQTRREVSYHEVESNEFGKKRSRLDLEIEGPSFLLFIETKVNSKEGERQLDRYMDLKEAKGARRECGIIYLTCNGAKPNNIMLHDKIVSISWPILGNAIFEFVQQLDIVTSTRLVLEQICKHFKSL